MNITTAEEAAEIYEEGINAEVGTMVSGMGETHTA